MAGHPQGGKNGVKLLAGCWQGKIWGKNRGKSYGDVAERSK